MWHGARGVVLGTCMRAAECRRACASVVGAHGSVLRASSVRERQAASAGAVGAAAHEQRTWPLQAGPAPMPMVGMLSALVTAAAMGPGTHSSTSAKQPLSCSALAWWITRSASPATCACGRKPPAARQGKAGGERQRRQGLRLRSADARLLAPAAAAAACAASIAQLPCCCCCSCCQHHSRSPSTDTLCGVSPTWPMTATPASTIARAASTRAGLPPACARACNSHPPRHASAHQAQ